MGSPIVSLMSTAVKVLPITFCRLCVGKSGLSMGINMLLFWLKIQIQWLRLLRGSAISCSFQILGVASDLSYDSEKLSIFWVQSSKVSIDRLYVCRCCDLWWYSSLIITRNSFQRLFINYTHCHGIWSSLEAKDYFRFESMDKNEESIYPIVKFVYLSSNLRVYS